MISGTQSSHREADSEIESEDMTTPVMEVRTVWKEESVQPGEGTMFVSKSALRSTKTVGDRREDEVVHSVHDRSTGCTVEEGETCHPSIPPRGGCSLSRMA